MAELRASIVRQGESVLISVSSVPGRSYRLVYKESLSDSSWTPLGDDVIAVDANLTFTDGPAGGGQRFYRVLLVN